ncbi:MAG TPA: SET domain-containing protein [Puia sp.]|jgi:SET domain-containing protein|nr:SET domain-containing protein [Puia sp.]
MTLLEKHLIIKRSRIPGAGKGLYTRISISKGTLITEYKGKNTTWKDVVHDEGRNSYIYYVKRSHVIDASANKKMLARYANDAQGLVKKKGIRNNCEYVVTEGLRVFIQAKKNIPASSEILVSYGNEYWSVIRYNRKLKEKGKRNN